MALQFPSLFQPIRIGALTLNNRIAMAPMGFPALSDADGLPTQRYVDYFTERARGGAGLLITGMLKVEDEIEHLLSRRGPVRKAFVRPFADLAEAVHALGTRLFVQLSPGLGCQVRPANIRGTPVAPSAVPNVFDPGLLCRELSVDEIQRLVRAYGDAAEILVGAGVDGIELHGHAGFLLDQFSTALWNRRSDRYGGDLRGRLSFAFEILAEVKRRVGPGVPVQYRYGLKHYMKSTQQAGLPGESFTEIGRDIDEGLAMAELLQAEGFDSLAVDAGSITGHYWAHPPIYQQHGCMLDLAAMVKRIVRVPVIAVGRLDLPELAERVVAEGQADIVSLAKGLLADPQWPNKVRAGRSDEIRPCIGCHQACSEAFHGRALNSCTVNPACGRERTHALQPALQRRRVLVAGGGVAGMEAARVAAERGHQVTLCEAGPGLGGHLIDAGVPEDKKDLQRLNAWYGRQLARLGVDVRLDTPVLADDLAGQGDGERPDVVIVATGSQDLVPPIPGVDRTEVLTTTEALRGLKPLGRRVLVVGAGENGCETALWLARRGHQVQIVERQDRPIALPVARANRNMLLDLLAAQQVPIHTRTRLCEVLPGAARVADADGQERELACDSVVLAVGMQADNRLYRSLQTQFAGPLYQIGDGLEARNVMQAVWEAYEVARSL
ncbi:MAG: FAD-dependent oxidoreductase [Burkholderiaceae bacterium]|nr:FAD-dependent oxidoreductase [Burkholderiaceae bacterium]